jgi:D-threo-aldose 1-dehydrogenase
LRSQRDQITITTKFGIRPPHNQRAIGMMQHVMRPLVRRLPGIRSKLARTAGALKTRARFAPKELGMSIEASLRALRTDYIDVLLLHEAGVDDLSDELFDQLERSLKEGKICNYGLGSEACVLSVAHEAEPRFCRVVQFEWSVLSLEKPAFAGSFPITHRSLSQNFLQLRMALRANPHMTESWCEKLGQDVSDPSVLSYLMLAAARNANPGGITLFSSRSPQNIKANAELLRDAAAPRTGAAFAALVAEETSGILASDRLASAMN